MLRIITAAIAGSVMIFVICTLLSKKEWPTKISGIGAGWKIPFVFLWKNFLRPKKLIAWTLTIGAGYGLYLLACNFWPTPEHLAFKKLSKNLAEIGLKPEKDKLAALGAKIKDGKKLTEAEKREAMEADKKIERVRKDYSGGRLVPSQSKPAPAKPKEETWGWTFEWEATAEQLASGRQKIVGRINDAQVISRDANVLKFRYKRPSGKIVSLTLDRSDPNEFYFGRVAQSDLYLRVWLFPDEKGNFNGRFDNGPEKISMEVFLKKKF